MLHKMKLNESPFERIKNGKIKAMYEIYSPEKEQQYGIIGIKIKINVDALKANLEKFVPYNEQEEVERKIMINYINDFEDVLTRQNEYGHFTSSAFVLNKERTKILMIYHKIECMLKL